MPIRDLNFLSTPLLMYYYKRKNNIAYSKKATFFGYEPRRGPCELNLEANVVCSE